jgi:hypothetical protein
MHSGIGKVAVVEEAPRLRIANRGNKFDWNPSTSIRG